jgi:hypothetical protein
VVLLLVALHLYVFVVVGAPFMVGNTMVGPAQAAAATAGVSVLVLWLTSRLSSFLLVSALAVGVCIAHAALRPRSVKSRAVKSFLGMKVWAPGVCVFVCESVCVWLRIVYVCGKGGGGLGLAEMRYPDLVRGAGRWGLDLPVGPTCVWQVWFLSTKTPEDDDVPSDDGESGPSTDGPEDEGSLRRRSQPSTSAASYAARRAQLAKAAPAR